MSAGQQAAADAVGHADPPGALDRMATSWRAWVDRNAVRDVLARGLGSCVPSPLRPAATYRRAPSAPQSWRPRVSVIVPCYRYGRFLPQAVDSLITQEGVDVEVIIVDDASPDDSLAVARDLAARIDAVTVVANERNVGHVEAFNNGWEQATGDLVVRLDADDLLPPGALARAAAVFEQHPEVGLVYGHPHHFDDGTTPVVASGPLTWTVWDGHAWLTERCRTGVACITSPEVVMRARVLRDVGPLDLALPFTPDMEQWMRLAAVSDVARVGGADQALHREHPASMSVTTGAGALVDLQARSDAYDRLFTNVGHRVSGAAGLHALARQALARDALRYAAAAADRRGPADEYLRFAADVWPASKAWRSTARVLHRSEPRGLPGRPGRAAAVARRVARRARTELMYLRWATSGL